jgi:hypothetical protein
MQFFFICARNNKKKAIWPGLSFPLLKNFFIKKKAGKEG